MRVLILGVGGMLGHRLWHDFDPIFDTYGTARTEIQTFSRFGLNCKKLLTNVDVLNFDSIVEAMAKVRPDVVVNCVGIIKQIADTIDPATMIRINSLLPHQLEKLCRIRGARLIHISTDCVFSGAKGNYTEDDRPDPVDLYGRTKQLGEVIEGASLTIRTSIIGRELGSTLSLVDWFLSQRGSVNGYRNAIYTGFTTKAFASIIISILENHHDLTGLYHVSADSISKLDLLTLIRNKFGLDTLIQSVDVPVIDRSLKSERFRVAIGFLPPSWDAMITEMADERQLYDKLRK